MEIAKGIVANEYKSLNLTNNNSPDWDNAIEIFKQRFYPRYIEPVDLLIKTDESLSALDRKFGFTIMAIDCLLLETLQCFYEGRKDSKGRGVGENLFIIFLTTTNYFSPHFDVMKAKLFYDHIRCGILHQAETKCESKIWSVGPLVRGENSSLIVNRTEFHIGMKKEFSRYINLISDPLNTQLRENFKIKMDFIAR